MKNESNRTEKGTPLRYFVMIRRTATGYSVDVPDVPGCIAVAKTVRGARRLIAEALGYHLDLMQESGEAIPPSRRSIEFEMDESTEEFCTWVEVEVGEPLSSPTGTGVAAKPKKKRKQR
jgi:predicted RNase H-like HicB family nuclease